jgi:hypothetical protein
VRSGDIINERGLAGYGWVRSPRPPALVEPRLPQVREADDDVSAFADYGLQSVFIFSSSARHNTTIIKETKIFKRLEHEWIEDRLPPAKLLKNPKKWQI